MRDPMTMTLDELRDAIIADGVVDSSEVETIRARLYADGVIDRDEAQFVFDVNDAVTGAANHESWRTLFVEVICDNLLNDADSPNEVDAAEASWLLDRIQAEGQLDDSEKALLAELRSRSLSMPASLKAYLDQNG